MYVESRASGKKSWQTSRARVSVLADLAIRKETVVRKLTELREAHDLTQERAAAQVGVTVRQWQRWESGKSVPYARNISAIAGHFGINEGEFFDPPEERKPTPQPVAGQDALVLQLDRIEARQEDILARLDRVEKALSGRVDAVDENLRRLGRAVVEGHDSAELTDPQPVPAPPASAGKKRVAASRTP